MKRSYLRKIYRYDETKNAYNIDVLLDDYKEVFHDWDASPTRKKDLNPELVEFLENSSEDIPKNEKINIVFSLPIDKKDTVGEERIILGINNYFKSILYFTDRTMKRQLRKIASFISLGFSFILVAYFVQNSFNLNIGVDVLIEGIFIGGWVLLWEAFSLFFFSMNDVNKERRTYQRFLESNIQFVYRNNE